MAVKRDFEPVGARLPHMIGALLRIPFQETVRRIHSDLMEAGFGDLRPAHFAVFQHLDPEGTRQTDLAERAQMTKQSMGYLVEHLISGGYARREPDPADGRASLVRLTGRGEEVAGLARTSLQALEVEWEASLGTERYREMRAALAELAETVGRR